MQVLLQSRDRETELAGPEAEVIPGGMIEPEPLHALRDDLNRLHVEILALYKEDLPPAVIHRIARGAHEQAAIAAMMLDDCTTRASEGKLSAVHIANAVKWIASARSWIEKGQANYAVNIRRKLCVAKTRR